MLKLLSILITTAFAVGNNPPVSLQGSNDASPVFTFQFQFPYTTYTHVGGVATWGVLAAGGGGTGLNTIPANRLMLGNGTSAVASVAAGTSGQFLTSQGASAPTWTTATFPAAAAQYDIIYASAANTWANLNTQATSTLVTAASGAESWASGAVANRLLRTNGTAVSFAQADLTTDVTGILPVANGGQGNNTLTANRVLLGNGTSPVAVTAAGSAGQVLQSNGASAPTYSTPTYPSASGTAGKILRSDGTNNVYSTDTWVDTAAQYDLLYASAANTWSSLAKANTSALVTSSAGVPSWTSGSTANRLLRTDGTTVSFAQAVLTSDVSGILPVGNGGTGTSTQFTAGSVVYAGASGVYTQDNSNFFYDTTNHRLGLGTTSPGTALDVKGVVRLSGASSGYVGLQGASAAGSTTYTLPSADGTNGYVLSTNGSGTLAWTDPVTPSSAAALVIGDYRYSATELSSLIFVSGNIPTAGRFTTLRAPNGTAGRAVTGGTTFTFKNMIALTSSTQGGGCMPGYGDTDVGLNSSSAPTNPIYWTGNTTGNVISSTWSLVSNEYLGMTAPAGKYLFAMGISNASTMCFAYGNEL